MIIHKSLRFVLLPLGLLVGGCNLFFDLKPLPADTAAGDMASLDEDIVSDAGLDQGGTTLIDAGIDADPDAPDMIEAPNTWRYVATGTRHSCGITTTGQTYCWGYGGEYQLGNGDTKPSATPVLVQAAGVEFKALALSARFSCGLSTDDELYCWGSFESFNGAEYQSPTHLASGPWKKIDASRTHACGLKMDGELWCWGENHNQQMLPKNGVIRDSEPLPVPCSTDTDNPNLDLAVGTSFTCVVNRLAVDCTGRALDTAPWTSEPLNEIIRIPTDFPVTQLDAGEYHLCVVDDVGQTRCVGGGPYLGELLETNTPKEFSEFKDALSLKIVATGNVFGCGIDLDDELICWGSNYRGRLGRGTEAISDTPFAPESTLGNRRYTQISAGDVHTCALTSEGQIECWGLGTYGRLGDGDLGFSVDPVPITSNRKFVNIELGSYHTCGLQDDGVVACWGRGTHKGLGNGSLDHQADPVDVPRVDARYLALGGLVGCAVNKNNSVACWGVDRNNLLGNGDRSDGFLPDVQDFVPEEPIAGITVGQKNACYWLEYADTSIRNAYCWGQESTLGRVGSGATPLHLSNHFSRSDIRAGFDHVCGVTFNDYGACWGLNYDGQLGDDSRDPSGDSVARPKPQPDRFRIIQAAMYFSCGIDTDDNLWCWGLGGRLGDGTTTTRQKPVRTLLDLRIKDLGGQGNSMCAITMDNKLYCWGSNDLGAAGVGRLGVVTEPIQVMLPEDVVDVDGEDSSMCALGMSGRVYCWGEQTFYRAGNHVFGMKTTPTQIVAPL